MNDFKEGDEVRIIKKVEPEYWDESGKMQKLMDKEILGKVSHAGNRSIMVRFPTGIAWWFNRECLAIANRDEIIYA